MTTPQQYSAFRRLTTWVGVAGAAGLASAFTFAPAALAQEVEEPEATTEPTDTPDPQPEPTPTQVPSAQPQDASSQGGGTRADEEADVEAAQVEPDYGYNKFRVGVQLEDGSVNPDGLTTLGSEITITETGPNVPGGEIVTTCTTTLEDPVEPTTTYCEDLAPPGAPEEFADFYVSSIGGGSEITVEQTGVNDGLVIVDGTKFVVPCGECEDDRGDVLLTDAVISDEDDDGDDDEDSDEDSDENDKAALPNAGGPDERLLGYGVALIAGGGALIAAGRRPRGQHVRID